MLTALAVSFMLSTTPPKVQDNASQLVSKMLAHYYGANTMVGTIDYIASDKSGSVEVVTSLQFERPGKLYIKQVEGGKQPRQWLVASDGKLFSYELPANLPGSQQRLVEPVAQLDPATKQVHSYDVGDIYAVVRYASIGDRSDPLDIAFGRKEDLAHVNLKWMTVESKGKVSMNGVTANLIGGRWREYGNQVTDPNYAPGIFEMVITDDGALLRYTVYRNFGTDLSNPSQLKEDWIVALTPNGKPDESLFKAQN